jgi:hypothetical protein
MTWSYARNDMRARRVNPKLSGSDAVLYRQRNGDRGGLDEARITGQVTRRRYRRRNVQYIDGLPSRRALASYRVGGQPIGRSVTGAGTSNKSCSAITAPTQS